MWSKETPKKEGWYWIKYRSKRGSFKCPCVVYHFKDGGTLVSTAYNDDFVEGPNHGGKGLSSRGKKDRSIRFGPAIEVPK